MTKTSTENDKSTTTTEHLEAQGENNMVIRKLKLPPLDMTITNPADLADDIFIPIDNTKQIDKTKKATSSPNEKYYPDFDLRLLIPYPNHKFRLWEGERFDSMVVSIKERGLLHPIIAWERGDSDGKYTILSGHNRQLASIKAEINHGPVIVKKKLTDNEADFIVIETNLLQRSFADLTHSERAYCLKQHYDAIKKQGRRTDLINEINDLYLGANSHELKEKGALGRVDHKIKSRDLIALEFGLSSRNIGRYIRIAELTESFMKLLDGGILPFTAALDIAFIGKDKQNIIAEILTDFPAFKIDTKKSGQLRKTYEEGKLTSKKITDIFESVKPSSKLKISGKSICLGPTIIAKFFFKGESKMEIEDVIEKALENYFVRQPEQKCVEKT